MTAVVIATCIAGSGSVGTTATPERTGAAGTPTSPPAASRTQSFSPVARVSAPVKCSSARKAVRFYSRRLAEHRAKMGAPKERVTRGRSGKCPLYLARVLQRKARSARRAYEAWFERTYEKWRCIHEREGAWNDQNAPHYGGLQFDDDFQRTYGPEFFRRWGDAGNWPVYAQLLAAERAYRTRGFYPWPNTARACGLLG